MVVLEPLKITITNFPSDKPIKVNVPDFPNEPEKGSHDVVLGKVLYIESTDFTETPDKGYRRLTPTQTVGLRHAGYVLKVNSFIISPNRRIVASERIVRQSRGIRWRE
jgi:glutaminyl-tRNA synthetase